jgi:beta-glucosidase-like glycosyl hydrolase
MVMMGHLHIPALDSAVSSISYPIVTGLLKEELGFDGLVVTDALTMKGVSENMEAPEIALAAYKAGVDILLKPGDIIGCIDRLEEAMLSGECDMAELDNRVRKTLRMKAEFGMLSRGYNPIIPVEGITERVKKPEHIALTQQLSEKSMTLVSNHHSLIPLNTSKKIAYIGYNAKRIPLRREYGDIEGLSGYNPAAGMVDSTTLMYQHILRAVKDNNQGDVHYFALDKKSTQKDIQEVYNHLSEYDLVILACHDPRGRSRKDLLAEEHVDMLSKLVKKYHPVLVHFGSPYGLSQLPWLQDAGAVLVGYQDSENNQRAAGKVLIGAIPAEGELPVTL